MSNCDSCQKKIKRRKKIFQGTNKTYLCESCFHYYENYKILYQKEPTSIPIEADYKNKWKWLSSHPTKKRI